MTVRFLTDKDKQELQENIDGIAQSPVQFVPQTLTEEQKEQARENIGAADGSYFEKVETPSINRLNMDAVTLGQSVKGTDGTVYENASYGTTDFIHVSEGEYLTFQVAGASMNMMQQVLPYAYICGYDRNKNFVSGSYKSWVKGYTVPAGVSFVRFSSAHFVSGGDTKRMVVLGDELQTYVPFGVEISYVLSAENNNDEHIKKVARSGCVFRTNGFTADVGASWTSDVDNHDMCGYRMLYKADITNGLTGSISMGKGYNAYMGGYVKVDATKVYYYMGTDTNPLLSEAHGLTLTDYVTIELSVGYSTKATIRIATNGGEYSKSNLAWDVRKGAFFVTDSNGDASNGKFSYYCTGWEAPTHLYGDSYFTVAYADRWPCYLLRDGHDNVLLNGYPGRASAGALAALKDTLAHAKRPERIIWCMGMNDGDDGKVDATWLSCVEELAAICDEEGIELILTTIPNVATVDNTYKNAYIKSSGRRYIDFAAAVGASSDTTWYSNMLSSDGVHPDVQGAIALYNQAITDVPELMA